MRKFLHGFIVLTVWYVFAIWYYTSGISNELYTTITAVLSTKKDFPEGAISEHTTSKSNAPLTITTDTSWLHQPTPENRLDVEKKANNPIFELDSVVLKKNNDSLWFSATASRKLDTLIKLLKDNPDSGVRIVCDFSANEEYLTPNLGIQRGAYLKKLLEKENIHPLRVDLKSEIKEFHFDENDTYKGDVRVHFTSLDSSKLKKIQLPSKVTKLIYPKFSFSGIIANEQLRTFGDSLQQIIQDYPHKKITIVGHTDNIGSAVDNYERGLTYARQTRWFLIHKFQIPSKNITALSKGEKEPIATNTTKSGRQRNLRIECIVE